MIAVGADEIPLTDLGGRTILHAVESRDFIFLIKEADDGD